MSGVRCEGTGVRGRSIMCRRCVRAEFSLTHDGRPRTRAQRGLSSLMEPAFRFAIVTRAGVPRSMVSAWPAIMTRPGDSTRGPSISSRREIKGLTLDWTIRWTFQSRATSVSSWWGSSWWGAWIPGTRQSHANREDRLWRAGQGRRTPRSRGRKRARRRAREADRCGSMATGSRIRRFAWRSCCTSRKCPTPTRTSIC